MTTSGNKIKSNSLCCQHGTTVCARLKHFSYTMIRIPSSWQKIFSAEDILVFSIIPDIVNTVLSGQRVNLRGGCMTTDTYMSHLITAFNYLVKSYDGPLLRSNSYVYQTDN